MKKLILIYGLIAGLVIVGMLILTFTGTAINMENGELLGYSTMIIAFSTIFFGIKSYRDKYQNGQINFGKAFLVGLGIAGVASVIYVASWMIMSETIAKDFMVEYYQHTVESIQNSGESQEEINSQIAEMDHFMELYKNPIVKIGMTAMEIFPVGFLIALISAFILKRKTVTA